MTDLRVRLIIDAQNNSSGALNQTRNDVRGIDDQFAQLQTRLNQFIAFKLAEVVTGWGAALVRTADGYQSLTAKLGLATDSLEEQNKVQEALFDIAQRSRASLEQTENAYIKNADAMKRMGGFPRRQGQLPGYGGGDQVKALLEAGEFVVRKEAVQALGGEAAMNEINAGRLPIKRATGGMVTEDEIIKKQLEKKLEEDANTVAKLVNNPLWYGAIGHGTGLEGLTGRDALRGMENQLRIWGREDLTPSVAEIMKSIGGTALFEGLGTSINLDKRMAAGERKNIVRDLVLEKMQAGGGALTPNLEAIRNLPESPRLTPNIPKLPTPAAAAPQPATASSAAASATMRVQFVAPNGNSVSGQFSPGDANSLLRILKDAGAITA